MLRYAYVLPAVVLVFTGSIYAAARPFRAIEIAMQMISEDRTYDWKSYGDSPPPCGSAGTFYGGSLRLERGAVGDCWDLHGSLSAAYAIEERGARWYALRPGIGGRLRIPNSVRTPVKLFVGGGATSGLVYRTGSDFSLFRMRPAVGIYGEFGGLAAAHKNFYPGLVVSIEQLYSRLKFRHSSIHDAVFVSFGVTLHRLK